MYIPHHKILLPQPQLLSGQPLQRRSPGLSGGGIAGVVIGVVVGITALAAALFFHLRKRRSASSTQAADLGPYNGKEELPGAQLVGNYPHRQQQIAEADSSYRYPAVEADAGYPRQERL